MCCNLRLKFSKNHTRPLHYYTQCCISPSVIWTGKKRQSSDTYPQIHLFLFVGFFCNNLNFLHFCIWHPKGLQFLSYRNPMPARIRVWKHCRQVSCFNVLGSKRYKAGWHRNTRPGLLDLYNVTQMVSQHVQFLFIANFRKQRGDSVSSKTNNSTFNPFLS